MDDQSAFRIDEFCRRNGGMSRCKYFDLKKKGLAPREMHVGSMILISIEAEREWRAAREAPCGAEARLVAREAKARRQRAQAAAAASVTSPDHVSKQRAARAKA